MKNTAIGEWVPWCSTWDLSELSSEILRTWEDFFDWNPWRRPQLGKLPVKNLKSIWRRATRTASRKLPRVVEKSELVNTVRGALWDAIFPRTFALILCAFLFLLVGRKLYRISRRHGSIRLLVTVMLTLLNILQVSLQLAAILSWMQTPDQSPRIFVDTLLFPIFHTLGKIGGSRRMFHFGSLDLSHLVLAWIISKIREKLYFHFQDVENNGRRSHCASHSRPQDASNFMIFLVMAILILFCVKHASGTTADTTNTLRGQLAKKIAEAEKVASRAKRIFQTELRSTGTCSQEALHAFARAEALDPLNAEILYNFAVAIAEAESAGGVYPFTSTGYFKRALSLAHEPDIMLKAAWNLAVSPQEKDVAKELWQRVLDVPLLPRRYAISAWSNLLKASGRFSAAGQEHFERDSPTTSSDLTASEHGGKNKQCSTLPIPPGVSLLLSVAQNVWSHDAAELQLIDSYLRCLSEKWQTYHPKLEAAFRDGALCVNTPASKQWALDAGWVRLDSATNEAMRRLLKFFEQVRKNLIGPRSRENFHDGESNGCRNIRVIVVGAGPVGMTTAIASWRAGANVSVYEQRMTPTRQHWFDSYGISVSLLISWGIRHLPKEEVILPSEDFCFRDGVPVPRKCILTHQCHVVERFLRYVGALAGIPIFTGQRFASFDAAGNQALALFRGPEPSTPKHEPFDVLFGCDGTRSIVRNELGLSFRPQNQFAAIPSSPHHRSEYTPRQFIHPNGISQISVILAFETTMDGVCPPYREDIGPFHPLLVQPMGSVVAVFKRFFSPFCELQILFSHSMELSVPRNMKSGKQYADKSWFPWQHIVAVCNKILVANISSANQLRSLLQLHNRNEDKCTGDLHDCGRRHALLFRSEISRASHIWSKSPGNTSGLVLLRGDALVNAHYRLGIGINHAMQQLWRQVTATIKQSRFLAARAGQGSVPWQEVGLRLELRARPHIDALVNMQLFTMWYEAYCDAIVDSSMMPSLEVLPKHRDSDTSWTPLTIEEIQALPCMASLEHAPSVQISLGA